MLGSSCLSTLRSSYRSVINQSIIVCLHVDGNVTRERHCEYIVVRSVLETKQCLHNYVVLFIGQHQEGHRLYNQSAIKTTTTMSAEVLAAAGLLEQSVLE